MLGNQRRFGRSAAALAIAATFLTACGGGGDDVAAPPTVTITDNTAAATASGNVTFTFSFSADVGSTFTADDIVVTGGTKGAFNMAGGTSATLVVTPNTNSATDITVSIAAGKFSAAGTSTNLQAASASQGVDTLIKVLDFESSATILSGFGDASGDYSVAADPAGGTNKVGKIVKSTAAEVWAGATVSTGANLSIPPLPLTTTRTRLSMRVYSPDAATVIRLKLEDSGDSTHTVETEATTTAANTWQTLVFDFSNPAAGTAGLNLSYVFDKLVIFPAFGTPGAGKTYYFDDLKFVADSGSTGIDVTFDDAAVTYSLVGFAGAEDSSVSADPTGGANKVVKVVRSAGSLVYAGTVVSTTDSLNVGPIPFTATDTRMTLRVWAPAAGIPVRLKVENSNASASVETEALTTAGNAWQTLTFDFANPVAGTPGLVLSNVYTRPVVFFNFGTDGATAGVQTYYFDDLKGPSH